MNKLPLPRIQLIHWNEAEAGQVAGRIEQAGYAVEYLLPPVPALLRELRANPPAAVVIDLGRLPSQGRDVAVALRAFGATRRVPIVFVGGNPLKTANVRQKLPDAVYTSPDGLVSALAEALRNPPSNPVAIRSQMDGYSGRPLVKKLGIKAGMTVGLVNEPDGFRQALDELPPGVSFQKDASARYPLQVWFVRSRGELLEGMGGMAAQVERGSLWIAWPKKGSSQASDVGEQVVRESGLAAGLVDYKICAIDDTWSGLLFARRKK